MDISGFRNVVSGLVLGGILLGFGAVARCDDGEPVRLLLGFDDCVAIALKDAPELGEAQADIAVAESRLSEAKSYRYPQVEMTGLLGPAPPARREDLTATDRTFKLSELTWFGSVDATLIQPLYTFGKISENMKAATHGIEVDRSRKYQRSQEIALKVGEYYYGLMLARELKELVSEVGETLAKAKSRAQKLLDQGADSVDEMDLFKLEAFAGEIEKYREEALKGEKLALAALKTRLGLGPEAPLDIKEERLTMEERMLPDYAALVDKARNRRPEFRQISEGLQARKSLVEAAKAQYYPDLFLAGMFSWAYADDRDRIKNPYITDQFRHLYGGAALGLRWKLDFGITEAKVAAEQAQYDRLLSTRAYAEANIPLQVKKYYLDLQEAEKSAEASKTAYTNAKKWAVAALANFDFGVGPAKDIFDGLQAYARMRASYFQSLYNYKIARAGLDYATAEPFGATQR